jgi:hypothetical protein
MSGVIQVPDWPGRGTDAHAATTLPNAVSRVRRNAFLRIVFRRLRGTSSSDATSTMRGSGECQRIGCPSEYQGKIPLR